jgi:hypothetical protein
MYRCSSRRCTGLAEGAAETALNASVESAQLERQPPVASRSRHRVLAVIRYTHAHAQHNLTLRSLGRLPPSGEELAISQLPNSSLNTRFLALSGGRILCRTSCNLPLLRTVRLDRPSARTPHRSPARNRPRWMSALFATAFNRPLTRTRTSGDRQSST